MFKNGRNLDLAEDPETPYAYDVSNPKTYELIGGVYREALDVFQPKYFHIGHDEVTMRGSYPHRDANQGKSVTDLFLGDVRWMHDLFKPRDVRMMLWGDMLLAPGEANDTATFAMTKEDAAARRAGVPKDAIVCDWHYQPAKSEAYRSLKVLKDAAFTTIACTWYTPENIKGFADAARLYGAWGLLQTTWAGYSITDATLAREARQFSAYLLAAEYAWSADSPGPRELAWDADETFARLMKDPSPQPLTPRRGAQLDLSGAATVPLDGDPLRLGAMPDEWRFDGVAFRRPVEGAVALASPLLPADAKRVSSVTVDYDAAAAELVFLQATAFPAQPNDHVGTIEITYADGTTAPGVELRYGRNTRAWTDRGPAPDATLAWSGKTPDGLPVSLRLVRWTNPHPDRRLAKITFRTDHPYASPTLLGITALD
jgi:hexosaminidase